MSRRNFRRGCGARTQACRVHTRGNAKPRVSATPRVILNGPDQVRLERVPLDIARNSIPFLTAPDPMIIGLALPERFPGAIENFVRLPRGRYLERFQEQARRDHRQEQSVDVVRHDREWPELVVTQRDATVQGINHYLRDGFLRQEHRSAAPRVEIRIDPGEGFAPRSLRGWRKSPSWDTAIQGPGNEQPAAFRVAVGQAAARVHKPSSALLSSKFSRSHECVRHKNHTPAFVRGRSQR